MLRVQPSPRHTTRDCPSEWLLSTCELDSLAILESSTDPAEEAAERTLERARLPRAATQMNHLRHRLQQRRVSGHRSPTRPRTPLRSYQPFEAKMTGSLVASRPTSASIYRRAFGRVPMSRNLITSTISTLKANPRDSEPTA